MNHSTALSEYITVTTEQTTVLILLSYYLLPSEDRAKDKGTNSIGSRLNRMEDKVGFVQLQWKTAAIFPHLFLVQIISLERAKSNIYMTCLYCIHKFNFYEIITNKLLYSQYCDGFTYQTKLKLGIVLDNATKVKLAL